MQFKNIQEIIEDLKMVINYLSNNLINLWNKITMKKILEFNK